MKPTDKRAIEASRSYTDEQNWEAIAHEVDDRYARCGGLAELIDELDQRYDVTASDELKRITRQDEFLKTDFKEAYLSPHGIFEHEMLWALAVAVWNGVRRSSGYSEMAVSTPKARDGSKPPFGSMRAAWSFAEEARGVRIGIGPLSTAVAETSELAIAIGRAEERRGRDRGTAGGFIPIEWMASSPTHVGSSSAKNEDSVVMRDDVLTALERSVDERDVSLLALVVLGEFQRVPSKRSLGDKSDERARPQFERVRLTHKEAARRARERGDTDSEEAIKQRIGRAKDAFRRALEERRLIPETTWRAPRATRARQLDRFELMDRAEQAAGR